MIEKQLVKEYKERPKADSSEKIVELCDDFRDSEREIVMLFLMDVRLRVIRREVLSIGNLNSSIMCPRELFKRAVLCNASSVIIVHNHPSGDTQPSDEDKKVTKHLKDAGKILNLPLTDHIIVTKNSFQQVEA